MKRGALIFYTWLVVIAAGAVVAADIVVELTLNISLFGGDMLAGLMGVGAGVLAIIFQRRSEFVATVRAEWSACLEAIAQVRTLYHRDQFDQLIYDNAYSKIWAAIDGMRSVYRDQGESRARVGYYPFATLHDIRLIIEHDFAGGAWPDADSRRRRMDQIESAWRLFRYRYLQELETPEPDNPVLGRLALDDRVLGVGWWSRNVRRLPERKILEEKDLEIPRPSVPPDV
jgi:hypothetical protein